MNEFLSGIYGSLHRYLVALVNTVVSLPVYNEKDEAANEFIQGHYFQSVCSGYVPRYICQQASYILQTAEYHSPPNIDIWYVLVRYLEDCLDRNASSSALLKSTVPWILTYTHLPIYLFNDKGLTDGWIGLLCISYLGLFK